MTAPGPPKLGRYELITRIGQGGMAEVQLALQRGPAGFEKLVVVKLVHENLATQKTFVDMLLDEARVAALVKHPNVVDIYDLGEAEGRYFIAMEYLEGEPLLAVLRAGRDGQRLDVLSTARLVADTAEGLDAAHELRSMAGDPIELVHHDVSLGNIVVLYNGQVKLVDFGVAKASQSSTANNKVQGKFGYMAPEKLRGEAGDRRSDIWSLGCVLWEALTLRRLFKGGNDTDTMQQVLDSKIMAPSAVNGDVPADFDPIVLRALARDRELRYPTAKAMAADLEAVLRTHGYAAKNDQIAKHMQATFASHIAARKKLLQEVSSKGLASPDVVEAAFHNVAIASGTPILPTNDAWLPRNRLAQASGEHTPQVIALPRRDDSGLSTPAPVRVLGSSEIPLDLGAQHGDEPTEMEHAPVRATHRGPLIAIAVGAIVAIGIAAAVIMGQPEHPAAVEHVAGPATNVAPEVARPIEPAVAPPPAPAAPAMIPPGKPAEPAGHEAAPAVEPAKISDKPAGKPSDRDASAKGPPAPIVRHVAASRPVAIKQASDKAAPDKAAPDKAAPDKAAPDKSAPDKLVPDKLVIDKPPDKAAPDKLEKINVDEVFKTGLQAWVHGDARTALASYKRVLQANASFAPAWRGLGLVHEKLGDRASARAAFQKYLQLAPTAADAASIRARIDSP